MVSTLFATKLAETDPLAGQGDKRLPAGLLETELVPDSRQVRPL
jgi:hypothetical protein